MTRDKLQEAREGLADAFNEANLNATGSLSAQNSFDHEAFSDAFGKPHLNAANTEQSFARCDHAALTGLFTEPGSERQSPTSFNQAFAEMLSERSALKRNAHTPEPCFDHQALAEMLNEPAPLSTNTTPSQPSFDHQALAVMLTESRADPIDPLTPTLSLNTDLLSSSASQSDQGEHEEPVTKAFTTTSPADAEGARPSIAKSLLAQLHHVSSTKEEPSLLVVEKDASSQPFSQSSRPEAIERGFSAQPAFRFEKHPSTASAATEPTLHLRNKPTSEEFSDRSKEITSVPSSAAPSPPTSVENAYPQRLRSLLAALAPKTSSDPTPSPATTPTAFSTQAGDPQPAVKAVSPSASTEVQPGVTERLLREILSPASSNTKSHSLILENETSPIPLCGERDVPGPAIDRVALTPPVHAAAEQSRSLPLTDLPALVSTDAKSSVPTYKHALPLRRPESVEPWARSFVVAPNEAEDALPQHGSSLLTALHVLITKPSPPPLEKGAPAPRVARPDIAKMSIKPIAHLADPENALVYPPESLTPEMPPTVPTDANFSTPEFEEERRRLPVSEQPANQVLTTAEPAAVASSTDADSVVAQAQRATSLLAEMDLNTAIHFRWMMRDIKSKRTKFSPVSADDLTALVNLGFVELREGLPRLTGLGILALD